MDMFVTEVWCEVNLEKKLKMAEKIKKTPRPGWNWWIGAQQTNNVLCIAYKYTTFCFDMSEKP